MTPLDASILERKVEFICQALSKMEEILRKGPKAYLSSFDAQIMMERHIERLVEASVDAASHILKQDFKLVAPTYRKALEELGRQGVITPDLAKVVAPFASLRNVITHQYAEVDHKKVFKAAKDAVKIFPRYATAIGKHANRKTR